MQISSRIHAQPGRVQHLVLDVAFEGKAFFAAVVVGDTRETPPTTSAIGNETLRRLTAAQSGSSASERVHVVPVTSAGKALDRIRAVGNAVARHDAVAFFCADDEIAAAVLRALNLQRA